MNEKEQIEVLQEDIEGAMLSMWTEANPLSIAMLRLWGSFHVVDLTKAQMVNTEIGRFYALPREAVALITKWLAGEKVEPCTVELECVDQNFYNFILGKGPSTNEPLKT